MKLDPSALYVVSCTAKKEVPLHAAPAKDVYKGTRFLKWLEILRQAALEGWGVNWAVLSSKYGLIYPGTHIKNYDVTFDQPGHISDQDLIGQAYWYKGYATVIAVNCDPLYLAKVKMCFPDHEIKEVDLGKEEPVS